MTPETKPEILWRSVIAIGFLCFAIIPLFVFAAIEGVQKLIVRCGV